MSIKRSFLPQTNLSQSNLDYIQKEMGSGPLKHARSRARKDSAEFQRFIKSEKKKAETRKKS